MTLVRTAMTGRSLIPLISIYGFSEPAWTRRAENVPLGW
jgi:hypothetical protein